MDPPRLPRAVLEAIRVVIAYLQEQQQGACIIRRSGSWTLQATEIPLPTQGQHPRRYQQQVCAVHPGIVLHLYGNGELRCPQCHKERQDADP